VSVIVLTVFIGLVLVGFFVVFFLYLTSHRGCAERESLLPLQEEGVRPASRGTKR